MMLRVEILNCLEVEETVSGFLIIVLISHHLILESLGSPLCEDVRHLEVDKEREQLDASELPGEDGQRNRESHCDLYAQAE